MENKKVRVRFAPSPTGPLHIGGVRTALYNYLFAKKHGGDFILRIEDTDSTRYVPGAEDYIVASLKWAGITPNEGFGFGDGPFGPYKQSDRKSMYRTYAEELVKNGFAYYAYDTKEELDKAKAATKDMFIYNSATRDRMNNSLTHGAPTDKPYVIRAKIPRNESIRFHDSIRGWVTVDNNTLDDKVLFKSDGMPTYHLANIVDDHLMEISHVIRGEEWLPSTPLHVFLYKSFGWEAPEFVHLPLILAPFGSGKLSKRDGDKYGFPVFPMDWNDAATGTTFKGFKEMGYLPEAFINMLALIGWNPGDNSEVMTMDEMSDKFTFDRITKAGGRFDIKKSEWYSKHYLKNADDGMLADLLMAEARRSPVAMSNNHDGRLGDRTYAMKACSLLKERMTYTSELWEKGKFFYEPPVRTDIPVWANDFVKSLYEKLVDTSIDFFPDNIKRMFDTTVTDLKVDARESGKLLRTWITGMNVGPSIYDVIALIGRTDTAARLWPIILAEKVLVKNVS